MDATEGNQNLSVERDTEEQHHEEAQEVVHDQEEDHPADGDLVETSGQEIRQEEHVNEGHVQQGLHHHEEEDDDEEEEDGEEEVKDQDEGNISSQHDIVGSYRNGTGPDRGHGSAIEGDTTQGVGNSTTAYNADISGFEGANQESELTSSLLRGQNAEGHSAIQEGGEVIEEGGPDREINIETIIDEIIQQCNEQMSKWQDPFFKPDDTSLFINAEKQPEYAKDGVCSRWVRPEEISENPKLYIDGAKPGDIKQGTLGDCWLLGAFCTLSTRGDLLENLFVETEYMESHGFIVCQFFKNGEWKQVVIDTLLPYSDDSNTLLYGRCADKNEFWVPLLEKAYAKLHGSYEILNGGSMTEALVDLTGGASEKYNLRDPDTTKMIENGEIWSMLKKNHQLGYLLGCANSQKNDKGEAEEAMGDKGILANHAYGIMDTRDIDGLQLIRIRNPWGMGEWKGAFADEDEEWDKHRALRERLDYEFKDDGTWWMTFQDWCENYNKFYICKVFPDTWEQYSIDSQWKGKTAGGACPVIIDEDEGTGARIQMDSDDKWFNNPQFRITVHKTTKVLISLMQADKKLTGKPYIPSNFLVLKNKDRKTRIWEKEEEDLVMEAADGLQRFAQREITKMGVLKPSEKNKPAHYIIIPNTNTENKREEERPFWLRVFASEDIDVVELPETVENTIMSEWTPETSGGRRLHKNGSDNSLWCRNPQFFLNLTKPTHLKIILRKSGNFKKTKGIPIGMTICRAPNTSQENQLKNRNLPKRTLNKIAQQTLSKLAAPKLEVLERKLQVKPREWVVESSYFSDEVAATYFFWQPAQGPYLIVPSCNDEATQAHFTLSVYSNHSVEFVKLEDSRNAVKSGSWTDESSGGSHLYDQPYETKNPTWTNNPKYLLVLKTNEYTRVKFTLSRPEKAWNKKIAKDSVGCMIGFYIMEKVEGQIHQKHIINNVNFMPVNELEEVLEFENPNPDGYVIMPATYDAKKIGPYIISVSTDVDFSFDLMGEIF